MRRLKRNFTTFLLLTVALFLSVFAMASDDQSDAINDSLIKEKVYRYNEWREINGQIRICEGEFREDISCLVWDDGFKGYIGIKIHGKHLSLQDAIEKDEERKVVITSTKKLRNLKLLIKYQILPGQTEVKKDAFKLLMSPNIKNISFQILILFVTFFLLIIALSIFDRTFYGTGFIFIGLSFFYFVPNAIAESNPEWGGLARLILIACYLGAALFAICRLKKQNQI